MAVMKITTVGDLRKALEGVPDEARFLVQHRYELDDAHLEGCLRVRQEARGRVPYDFEEYVRDEQGDIPAFVVG